MEQFPAADAVYEDVAHLTRVEAVNLKTENEEPIVDVAIFVSGFSCVSRSKQRKGHEKFVDCIQKEMACPTADTFWASFNYIKTSKPKIAILECVMGLLESKSAGQGCSDADFIVKKLEDEGYWARWYEVEALRFGSIQRRNRLYFLVVKLDDCMMKFKEKIATMGLNLLNSMDVGQGDYSDFLDLKMPVEKPEEPRPKRQRKAEPKFKDEHFNIFGAHTMLWPVLQVCHGLARCASSEIEYSERPM